jgi:hypothetical protein
VCIADLGHRSYNIQVGNLIFRRTSKHIRSVTELKSSKPTINVPESQLTAEDYAEIERDTVWRHAIPSSQLAPSAAATSASNVNSHLCSQSNATKRLSADAEHESRLRRFERVSKPVKRYGYED